MSAFSRRVVLALGLALGAASVPLHADPLPVAHTRRHIDRFSGTWSLGASLGAGAPLGVAGAFLELRPARAISFDAGVGFGGSFGPSVAATAFVAPVTTRVFSPQVGVSLSHHFSYVHGVVVPGRAAMPSATNWLGVEVAAEFRPSRTMMFRLGVGRAFLLGTSAFALATQAEMSSLPDNPVPLPGATPYDAVRAAALGETLGVWFVHLDIAPTWRF